MQDAHRQPLSIDDLTKAMNDMVAHKAPGLDGTTTEFFKALWPTIGSDYLAMVHTASLVGLFPASVTEGLIALLHKGGRHNGLGN